MKPLSIAQKRLSETLRSLRSTANLSLAVLSERLGVSKGYLSRLESGKSVPSRHLLVKLCDYLDADATPLMIMAGHLPEDIRDVLCDKEDGSIRLIRELPEEYFGARAHSLEVGTSDSSEPSLYMIENVDCFGWLENRESSSIHAIVTDPPYGLKEYKQEEQEKLRAGNGGVWRIPPKLDGCERMPVPRFTILSAEEKEEIARFFAKWAILAYRTLVPGGHVFIATNPLVSQLVYYPLIQAGFEKRGEIIRLVQTLRGGDRPKNAHQDFSMVTVMPRSCWEPWGLFRKPCEGRVQDNLRKWKTGGLRRLSMDQPFCDVIKSAPTRSNERDLAPHPSLKPQAFMRQVVAASLPLGDGIVLDTFMGAGSTIAAAQALGYRSIGLELDRTYFSMAKQSIPRLASLKVAWNNNQGTRDVQQAVLF